MNKIEETNILPRLRTADHLEGEVGEEGERDVEREMEPNGGVAVLTRSQRQEGKRAGQRREMSQRAKTLLVPGFYIDNAGIQTPYITSGPDESTALEGTRVGVVGVWFP